MLSCLTDLLAVLGEVRQVCEALYYGNTARYYMVKRRRVRRAEGNWSGSGAGLWGGQGMGVPVFLFCRLVPFFRSRGRDNYL